MGNNNSPLESLAAFAIVFVAGAASAVGLSLYSRWLRGRVVKAAASSRASAAG